MGIIYSPLLLITAYVETRSARTIRHNRKRGEGDEDTTEEWEQLEGEVDFEADGWAKKVEESRPNVETDAAILEVRELRKEIQGLREVVEEMRREGRSVEPEEEGKVRLEG